MLQLFFEIGIGSAATISEVAVWGSVLLLQIKILSAATILEVAAATICCK
ncbi:hypothetical protein Tco_0589545, partial [Tanacetum coccineum]